MPSDRPKILLVDDTATKRVVLRRYLRDMDADLVEAASGLEALGLCGQTEFALILLDVTMPQMDGFAVADQLSKLDRTRGIPIIFFTTTFYDDGGRGLGYGSGAVDYLTFPVDPQVLRSKVASLLEMYRGKQQLRDLLAERDAQNRRLEQEIAERKRLEELARHQATHDPLTGLPNRLLFVDRLQKTLERARRRGTSFAVAYMDIDDFKPVNDRYGHHTGDQLLQQIAHRLSETRRGVDTEARLGGDEFALIMDEPLVRADALRLAEAVTARISEPYRLELEQQSELLEVRVGASTGVAIYPEHGRALDDLVRSADDAMYRAKKAGKNRCLPAVG